MRNNEEMDEQIESRKNKILELINDINYKPMTINELSFLMEVPVEDKNTFVSVIDSLVKSGKVILTKKGKVMAIEQTNLIYGTFIGNAKGFGFVNSDSLEDDIFIPNNATNGAMNKDKVLCRITEDSRGSRKTEGEIVDIVERSTNTFVGTYEEISKGRGFVVLDDKKMYNDVFIPQNRSMGAKNGYKVIVKIISSPTADKNPEGVVTSVLGHKKTQGIDVLSIILKNDIPIEFSAETLMETEKIRDTVQPQEIAGRTDFRKLPTVTIDGEDTKDIDDAVSLIILENGNYQLGVHIADVSHYVKENSELDKDAFLRGTSVYLVDRVIPMLPPKLSNGICSLNPNVDRLTLSCLMEIDKSGKVVSHEICNSVINSKMQMTYTKVNEVLTNKNTVGNEDYEEFESMLLNMGELKNVLRTNRIKRGAIELGFAEAKVIVDETGKPIDIKPYFRNDATNLIEEFMLICNETIAEHFHWLEIPFVYRTHAEPDQEKIMVLSDFIGKLGYSLKGNSAHPKSFQKLLLSVLGKPEEMVVSKVVLRSLKQARYGTLNEGHFGLATKNYCHFTSPIRRYPDLQIHRIIKDSITNNLCEDKLRILNKNLPYICLACSKNERRAETAEREVENIKKAQFMQDKIGETFKGIISSVTSWGIYVELPNTVEGMVAVKDIRDDYYVYDEKSMSFTGERRHKTYSLGDIADVELVRVNLDEGKLDFIFSE